MSKNDGKSNFRNGYRTRKRNMEKVRFFFLNFNIFSIRKIENMKISCKSLVRDLEEAVNLQKKKYKGSNLFLKV